MSAVRDTYPEVHPRSRPAAQTGGGADVPGTIVFLHGGNVANWMWDPQVKALGDYRVLTPDLPGFGARNGEDWLSLSRTADGVAAFIAANAGPGPVHIVGLSMGAVVALHIAARYPELAESVLVSGAVVTEVRGLTRLLAGLQSAFWDKGWFWRVQARVFGLPADSIELYVRHGLSVRRDNAARMLLEVYAGQMPVGLDRYTGRLLAVAGQKEPAVVGRSFSPLRDAVPGAELRLAPGMHHVWNVENEALFNGMVRQWVSGSVHTGLLPVP